jgi:hypothetical protein
MHLRRPARLLSAIAAVAVVGAIPIGAAVSATQPGVPVPEKITRKGVGQVKLGATYKALHRRHLVGKIRKGCNLGGPNTRAAALGDPLTGSVDFTMTSPRKVADITVRGGATARGVGIGGSLTDALAAYPHSTVDHGNEAMFGVTLVKVPKDAGGRLEFGVDIMTKKISLIGIPFIAVCE